MVTIELGHKELIVHVRGWDKVGALRSKLIVPFGHIAAVRAHPREASFDDAIIDPTSRGLGVYVPGKFALGTVDLADGRSFFDLRDPSRAVAIDLVHEPLRHLVLEVEGETPEATVERIERAVQGAGESDAASHGGPAQATNQTPRTDAAQLVGEYESAFPQNVLRGATFASGRLVLASDAYLLRVDPDTGRVVDRLETFPEPGGLAFDGRYLWQRSEGSLQQLDTRTGFVVESFRPELNDVTGLECLQGDLLVLHSAGSRLTRIRIEDRWPSKAAVVVAEAQTGASLRGLSWARGGLWSSTGGELVRIDPATAGIVERVLLPGPVEVCDLAADADGCFWCVDGIGGKVRAFARIDWAGEDGASPSRGHAPASSPAMAASVLPSGDASPVSTSFDRILVPIDFSAASRVALATAFFLQERLRSEVHLFHLTEQGANAEFLAGAGASIGYGDLADDARKEMVRFVDNLFPGRASSIVVHTLVGEDLVRAINGVAREIDATLVLLAGRPRRSLFRTRIERVASALNRAVLVLRTEGVAPEPTDEAKI